MAAQEGWDALTVDQVARNARLSRALVYVYFKDKNDLLFGLGERAVLTLKERFEEAVERNKRGLDQVLGMGRAYLAFSQEFPVYFEVLARCELLGQNDGENTESNEAACRGGGDAVRGLMVTALANGVKDGSVRADVGDLKAVAIVCCGALLTACCSWRRRGRKCWRAMEWGLGSCSSRRSCWLRGPLRLARALLPILLTSATAVGGLMPPAVEFSTVPAGQLPPPRGQAALTASA